MPRATKRPGRVKPNRRTEANPPGAYVAATVTLGEANSGRFLTRSKDLDLIARGITQTIYSASHLNSTICTQQPLRLLTAARNKPAKRFWRTRRLRDRKAADFHTGQYGTLAPGRKAVLYAAAAGDVEEVLDHPARQLLIDPDEFTVGTDWFYLLYWFKEVAGRAYLYSGERDDRGWPTSLYHLFPQYTRIMPSQETFIEGFRYGRNAAEEMEVSRADVMYLRFAVSLISPLEAMSWVQAIVTYGDMETAAVQAEIARWTNGGNPGITLEVDEKTTDPQMKQIEANLLRQIRGVAKNGVPLILRRAKMVQYGSKPHEMQYAQGMERAESSIYRAAGIPETIWKLAASNRASAVVGDPLYMGQTINPRLCKTAEELTEFLLPQFGIQPGEMWFAYDNPVGEDRAAELAECTQLVDRGMMLPNTALGKLGYELVPEEFNVLRIAGVAVEESGTDAADTEEAVTPEAAAAGAGAQVVQDTALNGAQVTALTALANEAAAGNLPIESARAIAAAAFPLVNDAQLTAIFGPLVNFEQPKPEPIAGALNGTENGNGGTDPANGGAAAKPGAGTKAAGPFPAGLAFYGERWCVTKSVGAAYDLALPEGGQTIADEMAAELKALYESAMSHGAHELGMDRQAALAAYAPQFEAVIERYLGKLAKLGFGSANPLALADAKVRPEDALRYLETYKVRLARAITEDLATDLTAAVRAGLEGGMTLPETVQAVHSVIPEQAEWRAERIARTESVHAVERGRGDAYRQAGWKVRWERSGNPCQVCDDIADENPDAYDVGHKFFEDSWFGGTEPPAHPNCGCLLAGEVPEG